jgi:hypothetical protein
MSPTGRGFAVHVPDDESFSRFVQPIDVAPLLGARAVQVVLGCTRTRFGRLELYAAPPGESERRCGVLDAGSIGASTFEVPLDRPVEAGAMRLEVLYDGEQPELVRTSSAVVSPKSIEELFQARLAEISRCSKTSLSRYPDTGLDHRRKLIFFYQLDHATFPAMIARHCQHDAELIQSFGTYLTYRTRQRSRFATAGLYLQRDSAADARHLEGALLANKLLRPVFDSVAPASERSHAIEVPSTAHVHAVAECFEAFVDGDLALDMAWNQATDDREPVPGAPDGIYFLSFAEFVLYLNDTSQTTGDVDLIRAQRYWAKFLRVFAMCAEVFVQLHWSGGSRSHGQYRNRFRAGQGFGENRWRLARLAYRSHEGEKRLERTFSALCAHALRDQFPTPPLDLTVFGPSSEYRL